MAIFADYSKYYNIFYQDKDYPGEVAYVETLLKKHSVHPIHSILDIGCGTGRHAQLLAQKGYEVHGIDLSAKMISIAKEDSCHIPGLSFHQANATAFTIDKKFDAAVSLFHVMSYQTTDDAISATLRRTHHHLHDKGLLIFDFWYGPAVLQDPPETRERQYEQEDIKITRIAKPVIHANDNIVDVHYEIHLENLMSHEEQTFTECHRMRYFFFPELSRMLATAGFEIIKNHTWMSCTNDLSSDNWNGLIIAQKNP